MPSAKPSSLTKCFRQADIKPRIRTFFDTDIIVRFYTGLPSTEIIVVFEHVSWHVTRGKHSRSTDFKSSLLYLWNLDYMQSCFTVNSLQNSNIFLLDGCDGHFLQWSKRESFIHCESLTLATTILPAISFPLTQRNQKPSSCTYPNFSRP